MDGDDDEPESVEVDDPLDAALSEELPEELSAASVVEALEPEPSARESLR
ncbi:hypothetical protein CITRIK5_50260 [Citricoccus sp. K5]|nr:hypothetical protein CITRIK5_50260 [Citricoccus sp. K5]